MCSFTDDSIRKRLAYAALRTPVQSELPTATREAVARQAGTACTLALPPVKSCAREGAVGRGAQGRAGRRGSRGYTSASGSSFLDVTTALIIAASSLSRPPASVRRSPSIAHTALLSYTHTYLAHIIDLIHCITSLLALLSNSALLTPEQSRRTAS